MKQARKVRGRPGANRKRPAKAIFDGGVNLAFALALVKSVARFSHGGNYERRIERL